MPRAKAPHLKLLKQPQQSKLRQPPKLALTKAPAAGIAPVAVAIISKDGAKTIGACLDSLVPYVQQVVVCVDALTTDDTGIIARKHGAEVHYNLQVSEQHECPKHGKVLAQNFSKAREESFARLDPTIPWRMWVDADDIVRGAENLAEMLPKLPPDIAAVWMPYHYSTVEDNGKDTSTLFDRERIVRTELPWRWENRVHEILAPVGKPMEQLNCIRTDTVTIWHQGKGHNTVSSARRNILVLEIELEQDPHNARSLFYMGNQFFALDEWAEAIYWYTQSLECNNPYQLWQTYLYISMVCQKLNNLSGAIQAAHEAIEIAPYHPEPYLRLAEVSMLQGDAKRCEFWTRFAEGLHPAPFFAFKNPLDVSYNGKVTLGNAYFRNGQITKARLEFEKANSVVPTARLQQGIAEFGQLEQDSLLADSFLRLRHNGTSIASLGAFYPYSSREDIPDNLWKFGRIRDDVVPRILHSRYASNANTQPRIIFWCGQCVEPWSPTSINTTGIGGSETAVVEIAKRFAKDGWRVDIYNNPDKLEGIYEEVGYWDCKRLQQGESTDILIGWRNAASHSLPVDRKLSALWCHDLNRGPSEAENLGPWGLVLGVSKWHSDYLSQVYQLQKDPSKAAEKVNFVPNGINLDRYSQPVRKIPFRCVYASSPDRGLARLLRMWPGVLSKEPTAELHIAYGWDTIDKMIAAGYGDLLSVKQEVEELLAKTRNVVWRGRLPQDQLARLYQESYLWLYPTSFLEVSCISAMEAMAGGCVPVTSSAGALPETITNAGLIVSGNTYTQAWQEFYLNCVNGAMCSAHIRRPLAAKGPERVQELTWDKAYEVWKGVVVARLEGAKELGEELVLA